MRRLHRLGRPQIGMLRLFMPAKVDLSLKSAPAKLASERLEAGVLAGMCDQIRALTESFAADLALVGLFTGVYVCVFLHIRFLVESLSAVLTRVWPGVGMN